MFVGKKHIWFTNFGHHREERGKETKGKSWQKEDKEEHEREKSSAVYQGKVMRFTSSSKGTDFQTG